MTVQIEKIRKAIERIRSYAHLTMTEKAHQDPEYAHSLEVGILSELDGINEHLQKIEDTDRPVVKTAPEGY